MRVHARLTAPVLGGGDHVVPIVAAGGRALLLVSGDQLRRQAAVGVRLERPGNPRRPLVDLGLKRSLMALQARDPLLLVRHGQLRTGRIALAVVAVHVVVHGLVADGIAETGLVVPHVEPAAGAHEHHGHHRAHDGSPAAFSTLRLRLFVRLHHALLSHLHAFRCTCERDCRIIARFLHQMFDVSANVFIDATSTRPVCYGHRKYPRGTGNAMRAKGKTKRAPGETPAHRGRAPGKATRTARNTRQMRTKGRWHG